jgi:hypothetical protein
MSTNANKEVMEDDETVYLDSNDTTNAGLVNNSAGKLVTLFRFVSFFFNGRN